VLCKSLVERARYGFWGRLGNRQERGTSPTEGNTTGAGSITSGDGGSHARDEGSTIGLVQTVVHSGGEERILPTLQGVYEERRATTVEDGISPADLGWQDSACLGRGKLELWYGYDQGKVIWEGHRHIVVLGLHGI
jgi:hypothetical protein